MKEESFNKLSPEDKRHMPSPEIFNKDNVRERMAAFEKLLSEKDIEFLVSMAQEEQPPER
jgi:hypothetical protein